MNCMGTVICKLPRAGLGNQLFPLMKAYTFAYLNHLPVVVVNYHQVKVGPWLRGEKNKRNYNRFFVFQKNIVAEQLEKWKIRKYVRSKQYTEPEIKMIGDKEALSEYFVFSAIPHYAKRFDGLKENRELVISLLSDIIAPSIKKKVDQLIIPCIGVHIRMGDFRKLRQGEEFGKVGAVRTPEDYFINIINSIRKLHGSDLPVSVFTDGSKSELSKLFKLRNINLVEGNNALVDLLLLSRSKIIITSASSTFSYWAAFISEATIISHPAFVNLKIRPEMDKKQLFEGAFDENNEHLMESIQSIHS